MPGVQMPHCAAPCARKAFTQPVGHAVGAGALDCMDRRAVRLRGRNEAGADLLAVHQHRAGPAIARVAADLRAGEPKLVAQAIGERRERSGRQRRQAPHSRGKRRDTFRPAGVACASITRRSGGRLGRNSTASPAHDLKRGGAAERAGGPNVVDRRQVREMVIAHAFRRFRQCATDKRQLLVRASLCATGVQAPIAIRASSIVPSSRVATNSGGHRDGDHQIAPRAELDETAARTAEAISGSGSR